MQLNGFSSGIEPKHGGDVLIAVKCLLYTMSKIAVHYKVSTRCIANCDISHIECISRLAIDII